MKDLNSMLYDNRQYWPELHERLKGQLKAVGHPFLSEELNRLKYASEADSLERAMQAIVGVLQKSDQPKIRFLDIGAGTGFWTDFIFHMLSSSGCQTEVSALDVSQDALDVIKERFPYVSTIKEDLAVIPQDKYASAYDVVSTCYCLHHIVRTTDFVNALQFAGASVKQGGFLLIMDPVLSKPYSKFDAFDLSSFRGNGIPRHLYFLDDMLRGSGLERISIYPAVSFILNGCIEAGSSMGYAVMSGIWKFLCVFYRSERLTRATARILEHGDRFLKNSNRAFSSSLCVYQKVDGSTGR
jgi:SAM-dependent methyltransferase